MLKPQARHAWQPQRLGRFDASMAGDDATRLVDQNGIVEAELGDAGGDLRDLSGAMGARVAGVGPQPIDGDMFEVLGCH